MANKGKPLFMISVVSEMLGIHPQTLRLYEREGLIVPSRTEGNTRLYSEEDIERLRTILSLTRDLGVNLAGVEVILSMREKMEKMQQVMIEMMNYIQYHLAKEAEEAKKNSNSFLVKASKGGIVKAED
jgi:MerR family transcriptional regulator/heat shock protein HspR